METGKRDHISLSFEMTLTPEDAICQGENRNKIKKKMESYSKINQAPKIICFNLTLLP